MLEQELQLERDLFFFLNGSDSSFLDHFMWMYSYMWTWVPFYLCFLVVFIYKKNWREWLLVLLAMGLIVLLCDQISSGFCKPFFHRFRPTHHPDFKDTVDIVLGYRGGRYGFISGHAANSFGFATLTALIFRNRLFSWMIFIFAILTAYSRIYLGVHFISDVIAGALVGILAGWLVYELYLYGRQKLLKINRKESMVPIYTPKQSYFLCGAYCCVIVLLLAFSNQLVKFLS